MNTLRVFKFEFLNAIRKKSFIITNVILMIILIAMMSFQSIFGLFKNVFKGNGDVEKKIGIYYEYNNLDKKAFESNINSTLEVVNSEKELKEKVESKEIKSGYIIKGENKYTALYYNRSLTDINVAGNEVEQALIDYNRKINIEKMGLSYSEINSIYDAKPISDYKVLGKDSTVVYAPVYVMLLIVYMYYLLYGQNVAMSVAREKSDKTMEILITSTSVRSLIVGKVLSGAAIGTLSMLFNILAMVIGYFINKTNLEPILSLIDLSGLLKIFGVFLIFLILGYFLYLFIYASLGSLVSKVEEVGISTGLIQTIFIFVYLGAITSLNFPEGLLLKVMSFIPFSSPLTMFIRVAMTEVPYWQIGVSLIFMIISVIIFANISIKLYRIGSLTYGNRVKFFKALKMLREDKN